jgi:hypothetical protein
MCLSGQWEFWWNLWGLLNTGSYHLHIHAILLLPFLVSGVYCSLERCPLSVSESGGSKQSTEICTSKGELRAFLPAGLRAFRFCPTVNHLAEGGGWEMGPTAGPGLRVLGPTWQQTTCGREAAAEAEQSTKRGLRLSALGLCSYLQAMAPTPCHTGWGHWTPSPPQPKFTAV